MKGTHTDGCIKAYFHTDGQYTCICGVSWVCVCAHCLTDCLQEEIRATHGVWEREVSKQRNMDRVRFRDPSNRKRIVSTPTAVLCYTFCIWAMVGWVTLSYNAHIIHVFPCMYTPLLNIYFVPRTCTVCILHLFVCILSRPVIHSLTQTQSQV